MSLDTALQTINDNAIKASGAQKLPIETLAPVVVLNGKLVNLEEHGAAPVRHRAEFRTSKLAAFIGYAIAASADEDRVANVFVDPDTMSASAFFDLGSASAPQFSNNRAVLGMRKTAEFVALNKVHELKLSQKQAADFAIDWAQNMVFIGPSGEELSHAKALDAFRSITVQTKAETHNEERDTGRTRSSFEEQEAKSKGVLPAGLIFTAAPYLGLDERDINVRITINTEGDKPTVTFRIVGLEKLMEDLGQELSDKLTDALNGHAVVTVGELVHHN